MKAQPLQVTLETLPEQRVFAVEHRGPYQEIGHAFQRLGEAAYKARVLPKRPGAMVAVYHDNPDVTPAEELRSEAGIVVPDDARLPAGLLEQRLRAGRYARTKHVGPYEHLDAAWAWLVGEWLPQSGERASDGPRFEVYLNTPVSAQPHELETDLYLPLA